MAPALHPMLQRQERKKDRKCVCLQKDFMCVFLFVRKKSVECERVRERNCVRMIMCVCVCVCVSVFEKDRENKSMGVREK